MPRFKCISTRLVRHWQPGGYGTIGAAEPCIYILPDMPDTGWITVTGEGSQDIDAGAQHQVAYILSWFYSNTSAQVRIYGTTYPKRIQFAGSIQLQTDDNQPSGAATFSTIWSHPVSFEFEDVQPFAVVASGNAARKIGWKLRAGVTLKLKVGW